MKIAVIGSHQVGKTLLVNELSRRMGIKKIDEVSCYVWGYFYNLPYFEKELLMILEQLRREMDHANETVITDRSMHDIAVYSYYLYRKKLLTKHEASILLTLTADLASKYPYDFLIYVPPVKIRNFRKFGIFDERARIEIHKLFLKYLKANRLKFKIIRAKEPEARVRECISYLRSEGIYC